MVGSGSQLRNQLRKMPDRRLRCRLRTGYLTSQGRRLTMRPSSTPATTAKPTMRTSRYSSQRHSRRTSSLATVSNADLEIHRTTEQDMLSKTWKDTTL